MTIGERAAVAVREYAKNRGVRITDVMEEMGLNRKTYGDWGRRGRDPTAYPLQQMALRGMDVMWILLGEEVHNGKTKNDRAV